MMQPTHELDHLLLGLEVSGLSTNPVISNISLDSREILAGGLFIALKGERVDARTFIPAVLKGGAAAVLVDAYEQVSDASEHGQRPNVVEVKNLRAALSEIAARFYNRPSENLKVIGITGTNGKTTIAWYLAQVLDRLGMAAGIMGTLGAGPVNTNINIKLDSTGLTTPDAVQVQKRLAQMLNAGIEVVCMEVSSHGLELGRVTAVAFDLVVFSNISQDHLDFHQTMPQYAAAKMRLFERGDFSHAIINYDDELGRKIIQTLGDRARSYGIDGGDLRASDIALSSRGLSLKIIEADETLSFSSSLIGEFNVYNLLAVMGAGRAMGYGLNQIATVLELCTPVPGRMERIEGQHNSAIVVVDYAHTPDALDKALSACRSHCTGSLTVVFGCGGDRDKAKRPQMGRIAEQMADNVFITDDNPRSEPPAAIIADIKRGMSGAAWVLHDRAQAIAAAISQAEGRDWVLIAGKGHETTQTYASRMLDFDDRVQARSALERIAA